MQSPAIGRLRLTLGKQEARADSPAAIHPGRKNLRNSWLPHATRAQFSHERVREAIMPRRIRETASIGEPRSPRPQAPAPP